MTQYQKNLVLSTNPTKLNHLNNNPIEEFTKLHPILRKLLRAHVKFVGNFEHFSQVTTTVNSLDNMLMVSPYLPIPSISVLN